MILNFLESDLDLRILALNNTLGFLYGPLIWLYVHNIINRGQSNRTCYWLFFSPFLVATLLLFLWDISFFGPLILLQTLIYLALSIKEIKLYHTVVKQTNANSDASLNWLNQFIVGVVILFLFDLIRNIVSIQGPFSGNGPLYNTLIVLLVVMINLVVFKSLNHSSKFLGISEVEKQIEEDKKEIHLELDGTEIESFAERMESFLIKNETFRRAELTIVEFSELVNENPRIVSQVINHHFGTNFSNWINDHRLEYAKTQLVTTTSKEKNISQILFESGFNSTSSFYNAFSRKVGMTPKDFRKKNQ